jgi:hypothetical protein
MWATEGEYGLLARHVGVKFSSSIWIYGGYIVMGITSQKPHYALQMKEPVFASNLRTVFELLWRSVGK